MRTQTPVPASTVAKLTGKANALLFAPHVTASTELDKVVARLEELVAAHGCYTIQELQHKSRIQLEERRVNLELEIRNATWARVKREDLETALEEVEKELEELN